MLKSGPTTETPVIATDPHLLAHIEQNKDHLLKLESNGQRAAHIYAKCCIDPEMKQKMPTMAEITKVLQSQGLAVAEKTPTQPTANSVATLLPYVFLLLSFYTILNNLQKTPGTYARNLTTDLTLRTLSATIPPDYKKLIMSLALILFLVQFSIMFGFIPTLGTVFNFLPEEMDPKNYAENLVPGLTENYGKSALYALTPVVMLIQRFGPYVMATLLRNLTDNQLLTAAHEFCTLMRGGDDADELIRLNPEFATTWSWNRARQAAVINQAEDLSAQPTPRIAP
jgi:hypothetical protein